MDTTLIKSKFEKLGARATIRPMVRNRWRPAPGPVVIDIGHDRHGEFFDIQAKDDANVEVLDVQAGDRHLLLMVRQPADRPGLSDTKDRFLCGHDERHWFVAGIPEKAPVGTVRQAKEALKPTEVQSAQARKRIGGKARNRRKNAAFVRQGEWFFLPAPNMSVDEALVLRNEPLSRGNGGKPHWAEFCYRTGGETVYVCSRHPNGVTSAQYQAILARNARAKNWGWQTMRRNPGVYVRGRIRHPDHKTITLHGWHRVAMNTENESRAMRNVAFLD